jgi:hypothetical protein
VTPQKLGKIIFVFDERLSRQKTSALMRTVNAIRQFADVRFVNANVTEEELLAQLGSPNPTSPQLVMAPWYRYTTWSKVEAFYGLTRTTGATFVGYHFGQLMPYELGEHPTHLRTILVDFANLRTSELTLLMRSLLVDTRRTGLSPLMEAFPNTPIYYESWFDQQGLGTKIDTLLDLPEIARTDWITRASAFRITMGALWSLIYEGGPGKSEFAQSLNGSQPRAYFQVAVNEHCAAFRLCYSMPSWTPKDAQQLFWYNPATPTAASQLLLRHTDFLRVHHISEVSDVEVVAGFFKGGPGEKYPDQVHTLWVEPISPRLIKEVPYDKESAEHPMLKPMPTEHSLASYRPPRVERDTGTDLQSPKDRQLAEALQQIRELKTTLLERDNLIKDLRTGGVGMSTPLPPPEGDELLEAFRDKYLQLSYEIRECEAQRQKLSETLGSELQAAMLKQKVAQLSKIQEGWVRKLAETLKLYQEEKAERLKSFNSRAA